MRVFFGTIAPQLISRWLRLSDIVREGRPAVAVNQENRRHGILQSAGGKTSSPDELIRPAQKLGDHLKLAKAKNEIRVASILGAGSGIWGHCPPPKNRLGCA